MSPFLDSNFYYGTTSVAALFAGAATATLSAYAVGTDDPDTVADFSGYYTGGTEYYRVAGSETDFDQMFTYTGASQKTMVDSDGNLKWAPHNLLRNSDDLVGWSTSGSGWSSTTYPNPIGHTDVRVWNGPSLTDPGGASYTLRIFYDSGSTVAGEKYKFGVFVKPVTTTTEYISPPDTSQAVRSLYIHLTTDSDAANWYNTNTGAVGGDMVATPLTDGWVHLEIEYTAGTDASQNVFIWVSNRTSTTFDPYPDGNEEIYFTGAYMHRSDLGDMVPDPDAIYPTVPTYVDNSAKSGRNYLPRRNSYRYNGNSYVNKGITVESAAATNLLTDSNDLGAAAWAQAATGSLQISAGSSAGPDGNTSLSSVTVTDTTNEQHNLYDIVSVATGTNYTLSLYVTPNDQDFLSLRFFTASGEWANATFDLSGGSPSATINEQAATHSIVDSGFEEVGSGLYRIYTVFGCAVTDATAVIGIQFANAATPTFDSNGYVSYAGTGGEGLHVGFFQFEEGSVPTSYIPTSGATATRAAETLTIASANMAWSASGHSQQVSGEVSFVDNDTGIFPSMPTGEAAFFTFGTGGNDYAAICMSTTTGANAGRPVSARESTTNITDYSVGGDTDIPEGINASYNVAHRNTATAQNLAFNGTSYTENSTPTLMAPSSADTLYLGPIYTGTFALFRAWDVDIGDSGIERASDPYEVASLGPATVADFNGTYRNGYEYYRVGGVEVDFDQMFTYTGASNKVMTDSDGALKWAPHNILDYSTTAAVAAGSGYWNSYTLDSSTETDPDGGSTALEDTFDASNTNHRLQNVSVVNGATYTVGFWAKQGTTGGSTHVLVSDNNTLAWNTGTETKTALTTSWQFITHEFTASSTVRNIHFGATGVDGVADSDGYGTIQMWGWHVYRSDLGGMVTNPDRTGDGNTYVPTNGSAVYLPRRNSYRYNGSSYVNKGITLESAASTNLWTASTPHTDDGWTASTGSVSYTTGPTGVSDAVRYTPNNATSGGHRVIKVASATTTAAVHCLSLYVKQGTTDPRYLHVRYDDNTTTYGQCIDLTDGTITAGYYDGASASTAFTATTIEDVGSSWWRFSGTFTATATSACDVLLYTSDSPTTTQWTPTGSEYVDLFGVQLEQSSIPTSYIPTSGATATRAAETLTIANANMPSVSTALSYHVHSEHSFVDDNTDFGNFSWGSSTARTGHSISTSGSYTGAVRFIHYDGASPLNSGDGVPGSLTSGLHVDFNVAVRSNDTPANQFAKFGNAGSESTDSKGSCPTIIGNTTFTAHRDSNILLLRFWDVDIGESGIEEAST